MKIICIGRNYSEHAKELDNEIPEEPVIFMKPDTALLRNNNPFYIPDFSKNVHYEVELVVKIKKLGKNIAERFAHKYYDEIGLGIDFTARDVQQECKAKGLPWEKAKAFDSSAALSPFFINKKDIVSFPDVNFRLDINGETKQNGNSSEMIVKIDELIAYISKFFTLKIGDLIYTGTPAGVGPVSINDRVTGYIEQEKMLDFLIK